MSYNPALRGDVADLAGATELRFLGLRDCPLVVGEAAALAALVHLGEECSVCPFQGDGHRGPLSLVGSGVHGPVAALRALPGLGADWGTDGHNRGSDFSPCSAFGGCRAAGLAPVTVSRWLLMLPCSCITADKPRLWTGRGGHGGKRRVRLLRGQLIGAG